MRQDNGNAPILDDALQEELQAALEKSPPDHGLWTGPKVATWISTKLSRKVHAATGWRWLVRLFWSAQVPRRTHTKSASPEEQAAFNGCSPQNQARQILLSPLFSTFFSPRR